MVKMPASEKLSCCMDFYSKTPGCNPRVHPACQNIYAIAQFLLSESSSVMLTLSADPFMAINIHFICINMASFGTSYVYQ